jgi:hypothetical protein
MSRYRQLSMAAKRPVLFRFVQQLLPREVLLYQLASAKLASLSLSGLHPRLPR